jgi:hypothetical protein
VCDFCATRLVGLVKKKAAKTPGFPAEKFIQYKGSDDAYAAEDDVPRPAKSGGKKRGATPASASEKKREGKRAGKRVKYEDDASSSDSSSSSSSDSDSEPEPAPSPKKKKRKKTGELMVRALPPPTFPPCASDAGPGGLSCCDACFALFADTVLAAAAKNVESRLVQDKAAQVSELRERLGKELLELRELQEKHKDKV